MGEVSLSAPARLKTDGPDGSLLARGRGAFMSVWACERDDGLYAAADWEGRWKLARSEYVHGAWT